MLLQAVLSGLGMESHEGVPDAVSRIVRTVSALNTCAKHTKNIDADSLAVRNTVLGAVEPDTLLFESLPKAFGFELSDLKSKEKIGKFSERLVKSLDVLWNTSSNTMVEMKDLLLSNIGIEDREKMSKAASLMSKSVTDQKMKVFLNAFSADILERDED